MARNRKRKTVKKQQPMPLRRSLRIKNLSSSSPKAHSPPTTSKVTNCSSNKPSAPTEDAVSCSICLDTSRCRVMKTLDCKHTFHSRCVTQCLERNPHCPLCRAPHYLTRTHKRLRDDIHDSIMHNMIFYAFLLLDQ